MESCKPKRGGKPRMLIAELLALSDGRSRAAMIACVPVGLVYGLAEIGLAVTLQAFLAHYGLVPSGGTPTLPVTPAVAVLVMAAAVNALRLVSQLAPAYATEALACALRRRLVGQVMDEGGETVAVSVAEVGNLCGNLIGRSAAYAMSLSQTLQAALLVVILLGGMVTLSPQLSVLAGVLSVGLMLPAVLLRRLPARYSAVYYSCTAAFTAQTLRAVRNLPFLRLSGMGGDESRRLGAIAGSIRHHHDRYSTIVFTLATWPYLAGTSVVVALVVLNARHDWLPAAAVVSFVYLVVRLAASLAGVQSTWSRLRHEALFARETVVFSQRFTGRSAAGSEQIATPRELALDGVVVGRGSELTPPLHVRLEAGRTLLVSGPSGVGKSTLLLTFLGLVPPLAGSIRWNGVEVRDLDPSALRRYVGYAGADPFLLDDSVRANLLYGNRREGIGDAEIRKALEIARCDFIADLADGLDHVLHEGGDGISAGQKQRLAIARAILRAPAVLILDEATANIDETTEAAIMTALRSALPEVMVIAVSHRSSLAAFADHRLELSAP